MGSRRRSIRRIITKRVIVFLLLLLVGGAIVNVAVASAAKSLTPASKYRRSQGDTNAILKLYNERAPVGFPAINIDDGGPPYPMRPLIVTKREAWCGQSLALQHQLTDGGSIFYVCRMMGWPFQGFQTEFWERTHADRSVERFERGIRPPGEVTRYHLLYWPLWPGFAINTLFYAAILWALLAAPAALRRKRRIRRGQCPACGYPIGASEVCTECGRAVTPRQRAHATQAVLPPGRAGG